MEQLFVGNAVILLFWVCISFVIQVNERYKKILLMYLVNYIANIFSVVATIPSYIMLLLVLFLELEFLGDRFKKIILNNVFEKIIDFAYMMIAQYEIVSYTAALVLSSTWVIEKCGDCGKYVILLISVVAVYFACKGVSAERYKVNTFEQMKEKIDKIKKYRDFLREKCFIKSPESVLFIEDRSFFNRGEKYTFFNSYYLQKKYTKKVKKIMKRFIGSRDKKNKIKKFLRGYSTIEMQLLRTLAIQEGYNCVFRRKIYEIIYSRLFIKNLRLYYEVCECKTTEFKKYLLYLYMRLAPCLNKGQESRFQQVVGNRKEIELFSAEELFVLTLCFSGKIKRANVLEIYEDVIEENGLNKDWLVGMVEALNM